MNLIPLDQRITPKEVAAKVGCTRGTVLEWMDGGAADPTGRRHRLQASKIGSRHFTTWEAVHAFLDAIGPGFGRPCISPQPERLVELAMAYEKARDDGDPANKFWSRLVGALAVCAPHGAWVAAGGRSYRIIGDPADPVLERRDDDPAPRRWGGAAKGVAE